MSKKTKGGNVSMSAALASLQQQVSALQINARKGRGRSRSRSRGRSQQRGRSRTPGPSRQVSGAAAEIRINHSEYLCELSLPADAESMSGAIALRPGGKNNSLGHLGNLYKIYERAQWDYIRIHWEPAVGATIGGMLVVGMDWDGLDIETPTFSSVQVRDPNFKIAVKDKGGMVLPMGKMRPQKWISTRNETEAPLGMLVYFLKSSEAKGKTVGALMMDYRVRLTGPRPL